MKVKITTKLIGKHGIGTDEQNRSVFVQNGGYFINQTIDVDIISSDNDMVKSIASNTNITDNFLIENCNDEGLTETNALRAYKNEGSKIFELKGFLVSVDRRINKVADLLQRDKNLWNSSKLRIGSISEGIKGEVRVSGVNFQKAIENSLSKGIEKAHYCKKEKLEDWSITADMLVIIGKESPQKIQIEIWQAIGETTEEMYYMHGYFNPIDKKFNHLDGAVIGMESELIVEIFANRTKRKVGNYKKYFRIDTEIDYETTFEIIKSFMPISELVNEFECKELN